MREPRNVKSPSPERIVIRGVNWLGDAVMTLPAVMRLRQKFPKAHLGMVSPRKLADLWQSNALLDSVVLIEPGESPFQLSEKLRAGNFDTAIIFPNSFRSAFEAWWARIPVRIGSGGQGRQFLLNRIVSRSNLVRMRKRSPREVQRLLSTNQPPSSERVVPPHQITHYLGLVAEVGADPAPIAPALHVNPAATSAFRTRVGLTPHSEEALFGLIAGAEYGPAKRWPIGSFVETIRQVSRQIPGRWILFGAKVDQAITSQLAGMASGIAGATIVDLAGQTTVSELMAGLAACDVVLTNDTGAMHVACAVGTKVVALFGSTSPELTGPFPPGNPLQAVFRSNAACSPCFQRECPIDFRCMNGIAPSEVAAHISKLLGAS